MINKNLKISAPIYLPEDAHIAANSSIDTFYIGEPYCAHRFNNLWSDFKISESVKILRNAGKEIFLYTVADVTTDEAIKVNKEILSKASSLQVDGVVINDWSTLSLAQKEKNKLLLLIGNTMPVYNELDVKFFIASGINRIHLSEDISKDEMINLCSNISVPIEITIHGPICLSLSWKCLLQYLSNEQRKCPSMCCELDNNFSLTSIDKKEIFFNVNAKTLFSYKEICLINQLPDILSYVQPSSLFIESRGRGISYAMAISKIYKDALTTLQFSEANFPLKLKDWMKNLSFITPRNKLCNGYFYGKTGRKFSNPIISNEVLSPILNTI